LLLALPPSFLRPGPALLLLLLLLRAHCLVVE
jgi:hypothetical protein